MAFSHSSAGNTLGLKAANQHQEGQHIDLAAKPVDKIVAPQFADLMGSWANLHSIFPKSA